MKYKNEYSQKEYERKIEVVKELNATQDVYKFQLIEDPTNDSREHIELISKTPIRATFNSYSKEYSFYLHYNFETLPYVRYETQREVSEKYDEPNKVRVLSAKKVIDWVEYLTKVYNDLTIISEERVKRINEFEEQMKGLNARITKKDPYGQFGGEVEKNGLEFEFHVYDQGFIHRDIKVRIHRNTLENFLLLTDNKYIEEEDKV